jgi:hypothetical protein
MRRGAALAAVVVGCVAGCAARPAIPALPGQGGPAWHELSSPHVTMWTDADVDGARALVVRMEHHRQIVLHAFGDPPSNARIFVVALRDQDEVAAYLSHQFAAMAFAVPNPTLMPYVVVAADTGENREHDNILTHELTHAITFAFMPDQPAWFAEGLADYFATARLYPDHKTFDLGYPLEGRARELRMSHPKPFAEMLACRRGACLDSRFYATAWALFSFLLNNHRAELFALIDHLAKMPPGSARADPARAWNEALPQLPPEVVDRELAQWLAYGKVGISQFSVELVDPAVTERALADADALAARALLRYGRGGDAEAALAKDPTELLARLVEANDQPVREETARATAAAHPEEWRAWWLVTRAVPGDAEAREKMCAEAVGVASPVVLRGCVR